MVVLTAVQVGSSTFVSRLKLDNALLSPRASARSGDLLAFAGKQVEERMRRDDDRKDIMTHLLTAKTKEGVPAYTPSSVLSEARQLIVAGKY